MSVIDRTTRIGPYLERLIDNGYAQENLGDAARSIRAAYERASKRRVKPSRDEKLRRQVHDAAQSLGEAASALKSGRTRPKRRWGRRLAVLLGLGALGAAAALAASEELRQKVLPGGAEPASSPDEAPAPPVADQVPA